MPTGPLKHDDSETADREGVTRDLEAAKRDIDQAGGLTAFKSGDWFLRLAQKSFKNALERSNADYFREKYPGKDAQFIVGKLTSVAARNAALAGAITGAAISADEIIAIVTGGEGLVGIPANIAIALTALAAEAAYLLAIQMRLVAEIARLRGAELDPDDPEDILTIMAFALGGSAAEAAGKAGMKIGSRATERAVRRYVRNELLDLIQAIGRKLGLKILQRSIVKYSIPVASMAIGTGWNYTTTRKISRIADEHFSSKAKES